jgi:hypothetical protein
MDPPSRKLLRSSWFLLGVEGSCWQLCRLELQPLQIFCSTKDDTVGETRTSTANLATWSPYPHFDHSRSLPRRATRTSRHTVATQEEGTTQHQQIIIIDHRQSVIHLMTVGATKST